MCYETLFEPFRAFLKTHGILRAKFSQECVNSDSFSIGEPD